MCSEAIVTLYLSLSLIRYSFFGILYTRFQSECLIPEIHSSLVSKYHKIRRRQVMRLIVFLCVSFGCFYSFFFVVVVIIDYALLLFVRSTPIQTAQKDIHLFIDVKKKRHDFRKYDYEHFVGKLFAHLSEQSNRMQLMQVIKWNILINIVCNSINISRMQRIRTTSTVGKWFA